MEFVLVAIVLLIAVAVLGGVVVSMARDGDKGLAAPVLDRLRAAARVAPPPRTVPGSTPGPALAAGVATPTEAPAETPAVTPTETPTAAALRRLGDDFHATARAQDATLSRLDAGLARLGSALDARPAESAVARERRAETVAELYARLARLEAAIAAATNPVLLPGEPYAPPAALPPEALAWEHWKDVGERAFAFAEHFNANRLRLAPPLADEVAAFLTRLRGALTGEIYPNLRPAPAPEELETLRAALARLAADLPALRHRLDQAYRTEAGPEIRPT